MNLEGPERFSHFVRRVADFETLYGLFDHGWALMADDDERELLPVWPESEFAEACATGEWSSYRPESISLGSFLTEWVNRLNEDGLHIAVFPTTSNKGVVVSPSDLHDALVEECSKFE